MQSGHLRHNHLHQTIRLYGNNGYAVLLLPLASRIDNFDNTIISRVSRFPNPLLSLWILSGIVLILFVVILT